MITISICIPTYNGERYIKQAISSILAQSFQDFEIIIADHTSTDQTLQIVRSFDDRRITIVNTSQSKDVVENWNSAVAAASGEFVKVMGQDDVLYPHALETEVQILGKQSTEIGFCYSHRDVISSRGLTIARPRRKIAKSNYDSNQLTREIVLYGGNPIGEPVAVLFKRTAWEEVGRFGQAGYLVDLDFYLRLLQTYDGVSTNSCIGAFRIHSESWGSSVLIEQFAILPLFTKLWRDEETDVTAFDFILGSFRACLRISLRIVTQRIFGKL